MYRIFTGLIIILIVFLLFMQGIVDANTLVLVLAIDIFSVASGMDNLGK